ncbi:MAG TPA: hypothetical protein VM639_15840 [Dongiaceae bacterium]|nr:hypothetical protein [Dongiaceae bacterium]
MDRRKLEQQALDLVAGRTAKPVQKQKMSGIAKLSIWLWLAAVVVIGGLAGYVYMLK